MAGAYSTLAIGIHMGTTKSCVSASEHGRVEIIITRQGNPTTPRYVTFTDHKPPHEDATVNQTDINPASIIFDHPEKCIKIESNDPKTRSDLKQFQSRTESSKPDFGLKGEANQFLQEAIQLCLAKIKEIAETCLGQEVKNAVITVPASFNDLQRQDTKNAGIRAGLNVLRIINEPTAAALAYGLHEKGDGEKNVLIFYLGRSAIDVSILTIEDGIFDTRSNVRNACPNGKDFDTRLGYYFTEKFKRKFGINLSSNFAAIERMYAACEYAKRNLSSSVEGTVKIDSIYEGIDLNFKISRGKFEELCSDLFLLMIDPVEEALKNANMEKGQIDEIILVGSSTRIPKIQSTLREFFDGKEPTNTINPDEVIAMGAGVQAEILCDSSPCCEILYQPVSFLSLGIEISGGVMAKIICRNSGFPCKYTKTFIVFSVFDDMKNKQFNLAINVFEGERALTRDNNLLGTLILTRMRPNSSGVSKIDVTFDIDANEILTVSAVEITSGIKNQISIKFGYSIHEISIRSDKGKQSGLEIEKLVEKAERHKVEDMAQIDKVEARKKLEAYIFFLRQCIVNSPKNQLTYAEKMEVAGKCAKVLEWLDENLLAEKEKYEEKLREIQNDCFNFTNRLNEDIECFNTSENEFLGRLTGTCLNSERWHSN